MENNANNNNAKNSTKKVDINALSKLSESFAISEKITNSNKEIYKPELFKGLTSKEEKSKRVKLRNHLDDLSILFLQAIRNKNEAELNKIYSEFKKFYFENYISNNFSLSSVRLTIRNEDDKKRLQLFMDTMKQMSEK